MRIRIKLLKKKGTKRTCCRFRGRASASQCRAHAWLTRKSPPVPRAAITPKPEIVPAENHIVKNGVREELEVTKDNLRLFVERWREHPDSPYAVESPGCPRLEAVDLSESQICQGLESVSTRGQSPSPCGSICSSSDSTFVDNNGSLLSVPGAGRGAFERRASEGTGSGHEKPRDPAAQIVLAEEIIKLSEHLRAIAQGPKIGGDNVPVVESAGFGNHVEPKNTEKRVGGGLKNGFKPEEQTPEQQTTEISEKLSRIVKQRKTNGTAFGGVSKFTKTESTETTSFGPATRRTRRPLERSEPAFNDHQASTSSSISVNNDSGWKTRGTLTRTSCFSSFNSSSSMEQTENSRLGHHGTNSGFEVRSSDPMKIGNREIDLTPPWRRAKLHRFGETCRDVPRISNLKDMHCSLNLDEPTSTKNLLLQLLEEWDDGQTGTRTNGIGRKSVSLDWCGEESVARRSMNSLAEYFQSEQKKPPPGEPTPSVHR